MSTDSAHMTYQRLGNWGAEKKINKAKKKT